MQPLDSDMEYMVRPTRPSKPGSRFSYLLILPTLGVLWLLYLIIAAVFQLDLSGQVDAVMGIMTLLFFITIGLLFWAGAPGARNP